MARDYRLCPVATSRVFLPLRPPNPLSSPFGAISMGVSLWECQIFNSMRHNFKRRTSVLESARELPTCFSKSFGRQRSLSVGNGFTEVPIDLMARRLHNSRRCEKLTKRCRLDTVPVLGLPR
jgi:hypothetical protein